MKPGIYYDLPFAEYLAIDALNCSLIKDMAKSPAHAKATIDGTQRKETPALLFGAAAHCKILENGYCNRFAIDPKFNKRTKLGKQQHAEWVADNKGKKVITEDQDAAINGMSDVLKAHATANALISNGKAEVTIVFEHEIGVLCKVRLDWWNEKLQFIADYKTTKDATPNAFGRGSYNFMYDIQAYLYLCAVREVMGVTSEFIFIAQEKVEPFAVGVYRADEKVIESGQNRAEPLIETYIQCKESGIWPGLPDEVVNLEWPKWAA